MWSTTSDESNEGPVSRAPREPGPRSRVALMGVELARLDEAETIAVVLDALDTGRGGWICPVNLDVLRQIVESDGLRTLVGEADLVVADGMPLLWAARLQGTPLPGRVTGSSLIWTLSEALARCNRSVYLLGGNEGTAQSAGERLEETVTDFRLAGWFCPPFGFEQSPEQLERLKSHVIRAEPDVVFVGLGFPKQDRLVVQLRHDMPHTWFVSCGISLSFLIGEVQRAPRAMQAVGLEWIHRLAQEPTRLGRRYLVLGLPFAARLGVSSIRHRAVRMVRAGRESTGAKRRP